MKGVAEGDRHFGKRKGDLELVPSPEKGRFPLHVDADGDQGEPCFLGQKKKARIGVVIFNARRAVDQQVGIIALFFEDIEDLLNAGADKVSLNSSIVRNPDLISEASKCFGSQAIVAAIDSRTTGDLHKVFVKGGTEETELETIPWCRRAEELGAGEILLTSMNKDGTKSGYDIPLLAYLSSELTIPIIASGGAGTKEHFLEAFSETNVDACLAASLFHYKELGIGELKQYLKNNNIEIRI